MTPIKSPDPRFEKLFEAASFVMKDYNLKGHPSIANWNYLSEALRLASEPLKEVAGLSKEEWKEMVGDQVYEKENEACKAIADTMEG